MARRDKEPKVYDPGMVDRYTDYRRYLADALVAIGRSRADFADFLGMSRSMLSMVLNHERRIDPTMLVKLAEFYDLDASGRLMLAALLDLDNDSPRARHSAWAAVHARRRFITQERPSEDAMRAMASWEVGAVHALAVCDGFKPEPRWIAGTVCPPLTIEQAEEALQTLLGLGVLVPEEGGGLRVEPKEFWTEQQLEKGERSRAVATLQRALLKLADESLERFRVSERHSSASLFAVSEERFDELVARLREMERELIDLCTSPNGEAPNRAFALGIQLFPLSLFSDTEYEPEPRVGGDHQK